MLYKTLYCISRFLQLLDQYCSPYIRASLNCPKWGESLYLLHSELEQIAKVLDTQRQMSSAVAASREKRVNFPFPPHQTQTSPAPICQYPQPRLSKKGERAKKFCHQSMFVCVWCGRNRKFTLFSLDAASNKAGYLYGEFYAKVGPYSIRAKNLIILMLSY